jgi:hypothetical protein
MQTATSPSSSQTLRGNARGRGASLGTWRRFLILLLSVAAFCALEAAPAGAYLTRPFEAPAQVVPGSQGRTFGLAINQETGDLYVPKSSGGSEEPGKVLHFQRNGQLDPDNPELTLPPDLNLPVRVAVDNSGGASQGNVWVNQIAGLFSAASIVQQFNPAGTATAVRILKSSIPADGTPQAGGLPNVDNDGEFRPGAMATDSVGNLFVAQLEGPTIINEFSPDGDFVAQLQPTLSRGPGGIVIDAAGNIYLASGRAPNPVEEGLFEVDSSGDCVNGCAAVDPGSATAVAIDAQNGNLLVGHETNFRESQVDEYNSARALLGSSGSDQLAGVTGLALDEATNKLVVLASPQDAPSALYRFGSPVVLPDTATEPASEVTDQSALLHGSIGAAGVPGATCAFQYVTEAQFGESRFDAAISVPCEPAGPFSGSGQQLVHATVTGLVGGVRYRYRLVGTNQNGSIPGLSIPFMTLGPTVTDVVVNSVAEHGASLSAVVNPNGEASTYGIQYVTSAQYSADRAKGAGHDGFAEAGEAPVGGEAIGAGATDVRVSQSITGLQDGTTYHFRIVAVNAGGTTKGDDRTFTTFSAPGALGGPCPANEAFRSGPSLLLPDCRAYEQATAQDKNGGGAEGFPNYIKASESGGGITFYSQAGVPGGSGAQDFPSFLSSRGSESWSTQGLLPPQNLGVSASVLAYSSDLRYVVTRAQQPGIGAGSGSGLFIEDTASHSVETIVPYNKKLIGSESFFVAGISTDGSRVFFEASTPLSAGAASEVQNLYVWSRLTGKVTLAGVLPGGTKGPPAGSFGGPYDWFTNSESVGRGGAASSFYVAENFAISPSGDQVYFSAGETGALYLRRGLTGSSPSTVLVSKSQKTSGTGPDGTDPLGPRPAAFQMATRSGSQAIFLSREELTNDANTGTTDQGRDLYSYDTETGSLTDLAPLASGNGAEVAGVLGMSGDGTSVYFAANGVLADGAAPADCESAGGGCNVYHYEASPGGSASSITFIARVEGGDPVSEDARDWSPVAYNPNGTSPSPLGRTARVTADGKTLLFASKRPITGYYNLAPGCESGHGSTVLESCHELFRYSADTGQVACVSCDPSGAAPLGSMSLYSMAVNAFLQTAGTRSAVLTRNLSADGNRVFFETPDPLVSRDHNADAGCSFPEGPTGSTCQDVYEWEAAGTGLCPPGAANGGCVHLLSDGQSEQGSFFGDADLKGDNVFIFTQSQLVPADQDQLFDIYDARVDGGIAAQHEVPGPPCLGEAACLEAGPSPAPAASPGTASFSGPGNPSSVNRCRRGSIRKRGRCTTRHSKKKPRHKRHSHGMHQQGSGHSKKGGAK